MPDTESVLAVDMVIEALGQGLPEAIIAASATCDWIGAG